MTYFAQTKIDRPPSKALAVVAAILGLVLFGSAAHAHGLALTYTAYRMDHNDRVPVRQGDTIFPGEKLLIEIKYINQSSEAVQPGALVFSLPQGCAFVRTDRGAALQLSVDGGQRFGDLDRLMVSENGRLRPAAAADVQPGSAGARSPHPQRGKRRGPHGHDPRVDAAEPPKAIKPLFRIHARPQAIRSGLEHMMGQRILAIDDNEIVGWTLAARLWVAGYDVETVSSAAAGFEALKTQDYDLVLMDLEMPDCNGLDALDIMVRDRLCPDAPIVLLTASEHFGHVQQAYAKGARGYLSKEFASSALIKNIDRLMKTKDVVWIDDEHCVSKQIEAPKTSDVAMAPKPDTAPGARLRLVSMRSAKGARSLETNVS